MVQLNKAVGGVKITSYNVALDFTLKLMFSWCNKLLVLAKLAKWLNAHFFIHEHHCCIVI